MKLSRTQKIVFFGIIVGTGAVVAFHFYKQHQKDSDKAKAATGNTGAASDTSHSTTNVAQTDTAKQPSASSAATTSNSSVSALNTSKIPDALASNVTKFQSWYNTTNQGKQRKLAVDGIAGPKTMAAWNTPTVGALPTIGAIFVYLLNAKKI